MIDAKTMDRAARWLFRRRTIDPKTGKTRQQERAARTLINTHRGERVAISYDPAVPTGCWQKNGRRHEIKLGVNFDDHLTPATVARPAAVESAMRSLGTHECCHGLYTNNDAELCASWLAGEGIPFAIFNLFEDVRIEHLYRTANPHFKFGWERTLGFEKDCTIAAQYVLSLSHREASRFSTMTAAAAPINWLGAPTVTGTGTAHDGKRTHLVIQNFYTRACACATARDLLPLIKEWCDVFGYDRPESPRIDDMIDGEADPSAPSDGPSDTGHGGDGDGNGEREATLPAPEALPPNPGKDGPGMTADQKRGGIRHFMS